MPKTSLSITVDVNLFSFSLKNRMTYFLSRKLQFVQPVVNKGSDFNCNTSSVLFLSEKTIRIDFAR